MCIYVLYMLVVWANTWRATLGGAAGGWWCVCVTRSQLELNSLGHGQHNLRRFVHWADDEGPCLQAYLAAYLSVRTGRRGAHRQAGTHTHTGTRCSLHSSICCLSVCESERQTLRGCFSHRIQQWPLTQTQAHTLTRTRTHTSTHTSTHEHTQAQSSRPVHNVFEYASKSNRLSKWQLPWLSLLMCVFPASLYYLLDIYRIYLCPFFVLLLPFGVEL